MKTKTLLLLGVPLVVLFLSTAADAEIVCRTIDTDDGIFSYYINVASGQHSTTKYGLWEGRNSCPPLIEVGGIGSPGTSESREPERELQPEDGSLPSPEDLQIQEDNGDSPAGMVAIVLILVVMIVILSYHFKDDVKRWLYE